MYQTFDEALLFLMFLSLINVPSNPEEFLKENLRNNQFFFPFMEKVR